MVFLVYRVVEMVLREASALMRISSILVLAMGRHSFPGISRRFGLQLPLVAICVRHLR